LENSIILSITKIGKKLGELLEDKLKGIEKKNIIHINAINPNIPLSLLLNLPKDRKLFILVDVIATGHSLFSVIEKLHNFGIAKNIEAILSIVDVRLNPISESKFVCSQGEYKLVSSVRAPTRIYVEDKPKEWSWGDILRIDPEDWTIKAKSYSSKEAWQLEPQEFIKNVIHQAKGVEEGHYIFSVTQNHFPYFFLTKNICDIFGQDIGKKIAGHIPELALRPISHIVIPLGSIGLKKLLETLKTETGAIVVEIDRYKEPPLPKPSGVIEGVILLDSAISSGETIWNLLDIVTSWKPKGVYAYAIINRSSRRTTRRLIQTERYGKTDVTITDVVSLKIPFYKTGDCPICKRREKISELMENPNFSSIHDVAREEYDILLPRSIEIFSDPEWIPEEHDFDAVEMRVKLRLYLQQAYEGDSAAFERVMKILFEERTDKEVVALINVLYKELMYFTQKALFPKDFVDRLINKCFTFFRDETNWRPALAVAISFGPEEFRNRVAECIKLISFSDKAILVLFLEILVNKEKFEVCILSDLFDIIKKWILKLHQEEKIFKNLYKLVQAADEIIQTLRIEETRGKITEDTFIPHFRILWRTIFLRRLQVHDRLHEIWPYLAGLNIENAMEIIDKYYFGEDGFYELVNLKILPYTATLGPLFMSVLIDRCPYFKNNFKTDVYSLHKTIIEIKSMLEEGAIGGMKFERIWQNESNKLARNRINDNVITLESPLKKFMRGQFCHAREIIKDSYDYWNKLFTEKQIFCPWVDDAGDVEIFFNSESFASIINNLLGNIYKYAFEGTGPLFREAKLYTFLEKEYYILEVMDKGIGMSKDEEQKVGRGIQGILDLFQAKLVFKKNGYHTIISLKIIKMEHLV